MTRLAPILLLVCAVPAGAFVDPARKSVVVEAVDRTRPAVVNISTEQVIESRGAPFSFQFQPFADEFFRDFFDARPQRSTRTSLGSGVIVDDKGTILTNEHVILRGAEITVTLHDGRDFQARMLGSDADSDLAVLRLQSDETLPHVELGRSDDLMIGETVIAIGNPFALSHTVTTGVVSATGRSIRDQERTYVDLIQTDASINPGNSGGPLLNIKGDLIGINTAIYGKAQGIGFAIPVERARRVMRDLLSYGAVRHGWIGLVVDDLTPDLKQHFEVRHGVIVMDVEENSPAAAAKIERGIVISRIDGKRVDSSWDLQEQLESRGIGETVTLTVHDEAGSREITVTAAEISDADADALAWRLIGIEVGEDSDGLAVTKVRRGSPAQRIGVEPGDRLVGLGGTALSDRPTFRRRMLDVRRSGSVLLSVGRGRYQYNIPVPLDRGQG
jgi:serine protease Do